MWRWYLVHTKPQGEANAKSNLERQDYEIYYPRVLQTVRCRQQWREHIRPLFPRYLFLRLDEGGQSLKPSHSTLGVTTIVRFGSRYAIVPDDIIADLQMRADAASGLHRLSADPSLVPGTSVRVLEGPFEGLAGVFECDKGNDRVLVLLKLLGHEARVQVPIHAVATTSRAA